MITLTDIERKLLDDATRIMQRAEVLAARFAEAPNDPTRLNADPAARALTAAILEHVRAEHAPKPEPTAVYVMHAVTPRFGEGAYRGHCTCGWISAAHQRLDDVGQAAEVHLRQAALL